MRPYQQVAEVVSKLHNLDSIKESLKKLLVDIDLAKTKGESWIEEKEESSYQEIMQFIAKKTSEILQWLLSITKQYDKRNKNVADKVLHSEELQSINNNVEDLRSNVKLQTKKLQKLQLKLKEQQTLASTSRELEAKFLDFKEQILQELHSASTFMSDLQLKCNLISKEFKEHQELDDDNDKKMAMISQKTETVVKQQEELSITMGNIMRKMDSLAQIVDKVKATERKTTQKKEIPEFVCKFTGLSDVPCVMNCFHMIGQHEQQISEDGWSDLDTHLTDCEKNPGHTNLIPVENFKLDHLPSGHRNIDLFEFIKTVADLTVKVAVTSVSPNRPEFWPNTNIPYYFYNHKESPTQFLRFGSGVINNVSKFTGRACPCDKCEHSDNPSKEWWSLKVGTSANLIFDEIEASVTSLRLFYDNKDSAELVVKVTFTDFFKDINRDICVFTCVACDKRLSVLAKMVKRNNELNKKVFENYLQSRDHCKLMFIVSHPHGCHKQISIGQWKSKLKVSDGSNRFTHLTCTCPGSTGGAVLCVGYGWHAHSGSLKSGLNYSSS
ncbi:uncharacterized protein LOC106069050 isoform X2 [Biomphalaria glabrata]|uniref:Uncharacterized protein LOC106069050 isoform X2 n=1 Tax=Biomphalaria glabrata TaxID=6526 RepID=A0A9W3BCR1_BIOGL|nr:uncharacterized protein LOC106069050 isoform X2 [Biomphalaria glabrata]